MSEYYAVIVLVVLVGVGLFLWGKKRVRTTPTSPTMGGGSGVPSEGTRDSKRKT